jgi:hypothetical protein
MVKSAGNLLAEKNILHTYYGDVAGIRKDVYKLHLLNLVPNIFKSRKDGK